MIESERINSAGELARDISLVRGGDRRATWKILKGAAALSGDIRDCDIYGFELDRTYSNMKPRVNFLRHEAFSSESCAL